MMMVMVMVVTMMSFIPRISYVMKGLWPHCSCCWGKWGLKKDHWRQFQITFTLHIRVGAPVIIMANLMMVATSVVIPSKLTANHNFFIMSDWWHIFGNSSRFLPDLKIWSWQSHSWAPCCRMQTQQKQVHRELDQRLFHIHWNALIDLLPPVLNLGVGFKKTMSVIVVQWMLSRNMESILRAVASDGLLALLMVLVHTGMPSQSLAQR